MSRPGSPFQTVARRTATAALLLVAWTGARAPAAEPTRTVNDITFQTRLTLAGRTLTLVGMGEHVRHWTTIYVAGLYLEKPLRRAEAVIDSNQGKGLLIQIDTRYLTRERFMALANEGFNCNCTAAERKALAPRIKRFFGLFQRVDLRRGDRIMLLYLPGRGTVVRHQGRRLGAIPGPDFGRALFALWLGAKPLDSRLKAALLGG